MEFYCLIILCVKNLGVFCDSALCGVSLCNTQEESYSALARGLGECESSHRRLSDLRPSGRRPRPLLALPSGLLSGLGCSAEISGASHHRNSPTASCCPAGGMATLPTTDSIAPPPPCLGLSGDVPGTGKAGVLGGWCPGTAFSFTLKLFGTSVLVPFVSCLSSMRAGR